jgi:hypothetical protein
VRVGLAAPRETMRTRPAAQGARCRVVHVLDEEIMDLGRRAEPGPRVPRAHEGTFDHLRDECARFGPEIGARVLRQRRLLIEEEAAQPLLVCESGGRRPTFGSIAVACIERGRHGTSLAGVTPRSDGANMKEHSGDVTPG